MGKRYSEDNGNSEQLSLAQQRFCSEAEGTLIVSNKAKYEEAKKKLKERFDKLKNNFKKS